MKKLKIVFGNTMHINALLTGRDAPKALFIFCILLCSMFASAQQSVGNLTGTTHGEYMPGRLLIKFRQGYRPYVTSTEQASLHVRQVDNLNARFGCTAIRQLQTGKGNAASIYTLDFPASQDVSELVRAYRETGVLEVVEPDYYYTANSTTPNDGYFPYSWGLFNNGGSFGMAAIPGADIDMKLAWDITTGSSSVTMAIIDAGVKMDHPEFAGRIWSNTGEIAGNGIDDDGNGYIDDNRGWDWVNNDNNPTDDLGHGTRVAGIAGATGNNGIGYAGVDWHCKIMPLKTISGSSVVYLSAIVSAIYYATNEGARVLNMSFGGSNYSSLLQDALDYAYVHNVVSVAAVGNSGIYSIFYPAACNHVIAVGATNCRDVRASFSSCGHHLSVVAPGQLIYGLSHTSNTAYGVTGSGTSDASPLVAGVASLMLAVNPTLTPDNVKAIIEATAEDQVGTATEDVAGFDIYYGHGRLNAYRALSFVTSPITGAPSVCMGSSATLSAAIAGGTWTSSNSSIASINSAGVVTGVAAGSATITYTHATGATARAITVHAPPPTPVIVGTPTACPGSAATLTGYYAGGTWSSSNTAVGTVSANGVFAGIAGGTTTISYTFADVCGTASIAVVGTVVPLPSAGTISGSSALNVGTSVSLTNTVSGGTWSVSNNKASVTGAGVVTGLAVATSVVSYSYTNYCGTAVATFPISIGPGTVSGSTSICVGSTGTLSWGVTGGTWATSAGGIAGINSLGIVTGVAPGTAIISYTLAGGVNTTIVTINATPAIITGNGLLCTGANITLANTLAEGSWTSGNTAVATVTPTPGIVTGLTAGTGVITYATAAGCRKTVTVTVNTTPIVSGSLTMCAGRNTTLSVSPSFTSWASGNNTIAIMAGSVVTGVAGGTTTITYTSLQGCKATPVVTVVALPPVFGGALAACLGTSTTLTNTDGGGVWASSNAVNAPITTGGVVMGAVAGTSTISYTATTGCVRTGTFSVNALPTISGTVSACVGTTGTLSGLPAGGTWTSIATDVATVGTTGIVTGVSPGTAIIDYTSAAGCKRTTIATVNTTPTAIGGMASVCAGLTTTLNNGLPGGAWSCIGTTIATVNAATGIVSGVAPGTVLISYTSGTCRVTRILTVLVTPAAITGVAKACVGFSTTLSTTTAGGTWASSNIAAGTVGATGVVAGIDVGTTTITYTTANGCSRSVVVSVNANPAAISGASLVCAGAATSLTNATTGSLLWSSSDATKAVVSTAGVVTGVAAGTARITYTLGTGCIATHVMTINTSPAAITGTLTACVGKTTTLGNTLVGGTWSSNNTSIATVVPATGVVTAVAGGTTSISYVSSAGCARSATFTANANPAISGALTVCTGKTTSLTSNPVATSWASSNIAVATVVNGNVTGVAGGTATVTFTTAQGCKSMPEVTVNILPPAIAGTMAVCISSATSLSNANSGGTWVSSTPAIGSISTAGVVGGISAGTTTISYTAPTGCVRTGIVTVNALPTVGSAVPVCVGTTATITATPAGGTWASLNTGVAIVGTSGVVTGVSAGSTAIDYTLPTGCQRAAIATVNVTPGAIAGAFSLCAGSTTTLSNATAGGAWSSASVTIATIGSAGVVTAITAGTSLVSYTLGSCRATKAVTVLALPGSTFTGVARACVGTTTSLGNTTAGGAWSSNNTTIATVNAAGVVTGVSANTISIVYTLPNTCSRPVTVTINANPSSIAGTSALCVGSATSLTSATTGGTWWSSDVAKATVNAAGVVTGAGAGTANISYTLSTGCRAVQNVTVNTLPVAITGTLTACSGNSTTLANMSAGGTWASANPATATVDAATGIVTGIASGTSVITYMLPTGCIKTAVTTINQSPAALTGIASVCAGATTVLTTTGIGMWSSQGAPVATVNSAGIVTGVTAGTANIIFTATNGCKTATMVTVNVCGPREAALAIPGYESMSLRCYPNPTNGVFIITTAQAGILDILTPDGRKSATYRVNGESAEIHLPDNLAAGVYVLRFVADNGTVDFARIIYSND